MNCSLVEAGTGRGRIGQLLVSYQTNTVFVELINPTINSFPCASTHPDGFRYAFRTDVPGGREMLAVALTAKAADLELQVVGKGTCTISAPMEDVHYLNLL